jgi:YggT family protein
MFWPVVAVILKVISLVELMVILNVITRWADADPNNFFVRIVRGPTDPLLRLVRPLAHKIPGPIDWSPVIVLLGLELVSRVLVAVFR